MNAIGWMCTSCKADIRQILGSHRASRPTGLNSITESGNPNGGNTEPVASTSKGNQGVDQGANYAVGNSISGLNNGSLPRGTGLGAQGVLLSTGESLHSSAQSYNFQSLADVERVVRKTFKDASRRKSNVIISGLIESSVSGEFLFLSLCEVHLSFKPLVVPNGTKRLGSAQNYTNKPRRLLVHLRTEQASADLLAASLTSADQMTHTLLRMFL